MTSRRRRAALVGAVVAGLATLAACDKPAPVATLTAGSDSVNSEAVCYDDGKKLSESRLRECLKKEPRKTIAVDSGDKLRIGVDREVADRGWFLAVNGQPVTEPLKTTYRSFSGDAFFTNGQTGQSTDDDVMVTIVEASKSGGSYGVWTFKVKRS